MTSPKIIILHDTFIYRWGAERLVLLMAKALNADIATAYLDPASFNLKDIGFTGKMNVVMPLFFWKGFSWLPKKIGFIINNMLRHFGMKFFFTYNTKLLREYDIVIFSGDCLAGTHNIRKDAKSYYYCHTPPRYLFDQHDAYLTKVPKIARWAYDMFVWWYKKLYLRDIARINTIFTNSTNTKNRLKSFTGYDSDIIYPPVDLSQFLPSETRGDYYYSWARLASIKRVDRIVEAFAGMPDKKLIFSYGNNDPEKEKILEMAKRYQNITAIKSPDDPELIKLISEAIATIYIPIDEDFGMSPVESMACGVPVIWVNDGGLKESVIDGKTGVLIWKEADVDGLRAAIQNLTLEKSLTMKWDCIEQAKKFGLEEFARQVREKMN